MPTLTPSLSWLVNWALPDFAGTTATACKNAMLDAARAWYQTEHPSDYPNSIDAMLYAYLLDLYQGGGDSYADLVIADGATGYWRLGDVSGSVAANAAGAGEGEYSNSGDPTNVALWTPRPAPFAGGFSVAAGFAHSVNFANDLMPCADGAWSLELWLLAPEEATGYGLSVFAANPQLSLQIIQNGASLVCHRRNPSAVMQTLTAPMTIGEWMHVVYTHGASIQLFVNGVPVDSASGPAGPFAAPEQAAVGAGGLTGETNWTGAIGEVAYYPVTLTPTQVAAHYAAAIG